MKTRHLLTSQTRDTNTNTTVNMIFDTVQALNSYCRDTGKIRMYVLNDLVKDFLAKQGYPKNNISDLKAKLRSRIKA